MGSSSSINSPQAIIEHPYIGSLNITQSKKFIKRFKHPNHFTREEFQRRIAARIKKYHKCDYILKLYSFTQSEIHDVCSNTYCLDLVLQRFDKTFSQILKEKISACIAFSQTEIQQFIKIIINILIFANENGIKTIPLDGQSILVCGNQIKLTDNMIGSMSLYDKIYGAPKMTSQLYLAPQILSELLDSQTEPFIAPKAQIFTLGMLALSMACLEPLDYFYDYTTLTIDYESIVYRISRINYSNELKTLIAQMIEKQPSQRPYPSTLQSIFGENTIKSMGKSTSTKLLKELLSTSRRTNSNDSVIRNKDMRLSQIYYKKSKTTQPTLRHNSLYNHKKQSNNQQLAYGLSAISKNSSIQIPIKIETNQNSKLKVNNLSSYYSCEAKSKNSNQNLNYNDLHKIIPKHTSEKTRNNWNDNVLWNSKQTKNMIKQRIQQVSKNNSNSNRKVEPISTPYALLKPYQQQFSSKSSLNKQGTESKSKALQRSYLFQGVQTQKSYSKILTEHNPSILPKNYIVQDSLQVQDQNKFFYDPKTSLKNAFSAKITSFNEQNLNPDFRNMHPQNKIKVHHQNNCKIQPILVSNNQKSQKEQIKVKQSQIEANKTRKYKNLLYQRIKNNKVQSKISQCSNNQIFEKQSSPNTINQQINSKIQSQLIKQSQQNTDYKKNFKEDFTKMIEQKKVEDLKLKLRSNIVVDSSMYSIQRTSMIGGENISWVESQHNDNRTENNFVGSLPVLKQRSNHKYSENFEVYRNQTQFSKLNRLSAGSFGRQSCNKESQLLIQNDLILAQSDQRNKIIRHTNIQSKNNDIEKQLKCIIVESLDCSAEKCELSENKRSKLNLASELAVLLERYDVSKQNINAQQQTENIHYSQRVSNKQIIQQTAQFQSSRTQIYLNESKNSKNNNLKHLKKQQSQYCDASVAPIYSKTAASIKVTNDLQASFNPNYHNICFQGLNKNGEVFQSQLINNVQRIGSQRQHLEQNQSQKQSKTCRVNKLVDNCNRKSLSLGKGVYYQGETNKQGLMNGHGVMYAPNGTQIYNGSWANGKFDGYGMEFNLYTDPDAIINYKDFSNSQSGQCKYQGEYQNGMRHGFGTLFFVDQSRFSGNFNKSFIQGYGCYYAEDGRVITGQWNRNVMV